MALGQVRLGLRRLSNAEAEARTTTIVTNMGTNPLFASPPVSLVILAKAASDLKAAEAKNHLAHQTALETTREVEHARKGLHELLTLQGAWVESLAHGDPAVVIAAGFEAQ